MAKAKTRVADERKVAAGVKKAKRVGNVSAEVRAALEGKTSRQNTSAYEKLMDELQTCVDVARLCSIFQGIGQNAGLLSKHHKDLEDLLSLLFMFDWSCDDQVAEAFEALLCNLVSANAGFVEPCFQLLVSNLLPLEDPEEPEEENETKSAATESSKAVVDSEMKDVSADDRRRSNYIHSAIRGILRTVPLGCSTLLPVVCEHFPLLWCPLHVLQGYVTETLAIADYVPVLRDRLLAIVFERVVLIDSEIRVEDLEACLRMNDLEEGMFAMEDENTSDDEGANARQQQRELKRMEKVRELADKVDATLRILFKYCDNQCAKGPRHASMFFQLVLNLFDRFVLRSKSCSFVQYVIFYLCKKRTEFSDIFVSRLLAYVLAPDTDQGLRKQAIAYLASFIARSRLLRKETLESTLQKLMAWLLCYMGEYGKNEGKTTATIGFHPNEHVEYYLVWQAVVYILIYKGGDVEGEQLKRINLATLEKQRLSPFPFLPTYLVEEFANFVVSRREVFQLEEDLSSSQLALRWSKATADTELAKWRQRNASRLTLDFPFDPCMLEMTAKAVEPFYQQWFSVESADQEEVEMEAEEEEEEDLSDGEFSSKQLLVDPSRLPPAIRIPGIASGAMTLLGAGKQGDSGRAYWGFARPSITSSIDSNPHTSRVGSNISKGSLRSADVTMDDVSSSITSSFGQAGLRQGSGNARFASRNHQDVEDTASQLSGSW